jgi:hypothetical protein
MSGITTIAAFTGTIMTKLKHFESEQAVLDFIASEIVSVEVNLFTIWK